MWLVGGVSALLTLGFWVCWSRWPRKLAHPAGSAADAAYRRHPAGREFFATDDTASLNASSAPAGWAAPRGPDDDPQFLQALDRLIRGELDPGPEG